MKLIIIFNPKIYWETFLRSQFENKKCLVSCCYWITDRLCGKVSFVMRKGPICVLVPLGATRVKIGNVSISKNFLLDLTYYPRKFHAFVKKWTIWPYSCAKALDYTTCGNKRNRWHLDFFAGNMYLLPVVPVSIFGTICGHFIFFTTGGSLPDC